MTAFKLSEARPWGRDSREYQAFFDLAEVPRAARLLDCAAARPPSRRR